MTAEEMKAKCLAITRKWTTPRLIADAIEAIPVEPDPRNAQILSLAAENRALRAGMKAAADFIGIGDTEAATDFIGDIET